MDRNDRSDEADRAMRAFLDESFEAQNIHQGSLHPLEQNQFIELVCESLKKLPSKLAENPDISPTMRTYCKLYEARCESLLDFDRFREHEYVLNPETGWQERLASSVMSSPIESVADAEAYIGSLKSIRKDVALVISQAEARAAKGLLAPKFLYLKVISQCRSLIQGQPFHHEGDESPWLATLTAALKKAQIAMVARARLIAEAETALLTYVQPAYLELIGCATRLEALAGNGAGVCHLPGGRDFYAACLRLHTTTDKSADAIHREGEAEVERITACIAKLLPRLETDKRKFRNVEELFAYMRRPGALEFSNDETGRAAYLAKAERLLSDIQSKLDTAFLEPPKEKVLVRRVPDFEAGSTTRAFFDGAVFFNVSDMTIMKTHDMAALTYHEGIPGHAFEAQVHARDAAADDVQPKFRLADAYNAYTEGWGLYAEQLAGELGGYHDAWSELGQLTMELWRATRLVVDTGIHNNGWSRQDAVNYLTEHTPSLPADISMSVDRYASDPGQATSYTIGLRRILDLRAKATSALGKDFALPAFHQVILGTGSVPLDFLDMAVEDWIASRQVRKSDSSRKPRSRQKARR